mmetsp:Transcript_99399/g.176281  ORF Transcript_99399/g.176281 Transcript_99399/m.176281 type:complete len:210 (+) Transcript_99399:70-699(+)
MATIQELLLQKCLDKELPERLAELELQQAKQKLAEDLQDIAVLEKWHTSKIQDRMQEIEFSMNCRQGKVLFHEAQPTEEIEQQVARIAEEKRSLIQAWYQGKHGFTSVVLERNTCTKYRTSNRGRIVPYTAYGDSRSMHFCFSSAEAEAKVRSQCLAGRRAFKANLQLALALLRPKLPEKVTEIVKQFVPDYVDHLKHEKELVQKTVLW